MGFQPLLDSNNDVLVGGENARHWRILSRSFFVRFDAGHDGHRGALILNAPAMGGRTLVRFTFQHSRPACHTQQAAMRGGSLALAAGATPLATEKNGPAAALSSLTSPTR